MGEVTSSEGASRTQAPHALLLPYPAQGHLTPMLQLGKRLAAAAQGSVQVSLATMHHFRAKLLRAQKQQKHSLPPNFQLLGISDGLPSEFDRETWGPELNNVVDDTLIEGALELVHTLASQGRPVTCIVGDFFLRWTSSLAQRAALPEFIFWPQSATNFYMNLHVHAFISSGYDPFENNVANAAPRDASPMELITCIPGLPMGIHPADLPFEAPMGKFVLQWVQSLLKTRFNGMGEAEGVIANSFEALEPEVVTALTLDSEQKAHPEYADRCWPRSNIRLVGPLMPLTGEVTMGSSLWLEAGVDECKEWLDSQPLASVVFVAFGSVRPITVPQLEELALGLAASGQRFLWAIRENCIVEGRDAPIRLAGDCNSTGQLPPTLEAALPRDFLEMNKKVCKVVSWAPQTMVLSHPSVGGFFSHCGWNSTIESICHGVPILGWPWVADQVTNCWLVSNIWKVGITLERNEQNETSRIQVERGVRQLMEGGLANSLRLTARKLKDHACKTELRSEGFLSFVDGIMHLAH